MPEGDKTEQPVSSEDNNTEPATESIFSNYGLAATVVGVLSVAAVALLVVIWSGHRSEVDERKYQTRIMQTAIEWTGVLINMNTDTVDAGLEKLRGGTVGQLNVDFDAAVDPYRRVVQKLQSRTAGQVEAVAVESVHHDLDRKAGAPRQANPEALPPSLVARTDTVLVVATSISQNVSGDPQTIRWNLRLDVSDVEGQLMITGLGSIR